MDKIKKKPKIDDTEPDDMEETIPLPRHVPINLEGGIFSADKNVFNQGLNREKSVFEKTAIFNTNSSDE